MRRIDRVDLALAFLQRLLGAEHGAIGLHGALHALRICAVGLPPLAWRKWSSRESDSSSEPFGSGGCAAPGLRISPRRMAGRAAEHDEVDQAVGAEPVGAVDRDAGRLADREQAGHDAVRIAVLQRHDLAP
jgi:hypothetical protein